MFFYNCLAGFCLLSTATDHKLHETGKFKDLMPKVQQAKDAKCKTSAEATAAIPAEPPGSIAPWLYFSHFQNIDWSAVYSKFFGNLGKLSCDTLFEVFSHISSRNLHLSFSLDVYACLEASRAFAWSPERVLISTNQSCWYHFITSTIILLVIPYPKYIIMVTYYYNKIYYYYQYYFYCYLFLLLL